MTPAIHLKVMDTATAHRRAFERVAEVLADAPDAYATAGEELLTMVREIEAEAYSWEGSMSVETARSYLERIGAVTRRLDALRADVEVWAARCVKTGED